MWVCFRAQILAAPTVIYSTGFEGSQGFNSALDLEGQQGWLGTGGNSVYDNGLTSENYVPGLGQSAYIGYRPLAVGESNLFVWYPLNVSPVASNTPIVKFSVAMRIVDSTFINGEYDSFRWSVFNKDTNELFDLVFDNTDLSISYLLENSTVFVDTGQSFDNDVLYSLIITMDFGRNTWGATLENSATLDKTTLVTGVPITTANSPLTLGDIDAVWLYTDPLAPGDNFMLFDNYKVTAMPAPRLQSIAKVNNQIRLSLTGEPNRPYALEANTNLANALDWTILQTNVTALDGTTSFTNTLSPGFPHRFYRARLAQ
jgi:hypothetical protein